VRSEFRNRIGPHVIVVACGVVRLPRDQRDHRCPAAAKVRVESASIADPTRRLGSAPRCRA
jgi:cell division septation protein DedD